MGLSFDKPIFDEQKWVFVLWNRFLYTKNGSNYLKQVSVYQKQF